MSTQESGSNFDETVDQHNPNQNNGSVYWDIDPSYPNRGKSPWVRRGNAQSPNDGSPSREGANMEMQGLIYQNYPHQSNADPKGQPAPLIKRLQLQFIRFCETTSLRGIPRIVKTTDKKRKILWGSFVLTSFAGAITCLTFLGIQYAQYDVIHQPKTILNHPTPFPSFTICNTHPLSVEGKNLLKEKKILFPAEWTRQVITKAKAYRSSIPKKKFTNPIFRYLNAMFVLSAWLQSLPDDVPIPVIGQMREEMVLKCDGSVKTGDYVLSHLCDEIGVWSHTFSAAFVNCYSFTIHEIYRNRTMNLNINVFLGQATPTCVSCIPHMLQTQVEGVRLEVHGAGTYPAVDEKGLYLMPGSLTEIRFSTREWSMMEPPHGNCSKSLVKNNMTLNDVNFTYSQRICDVQRYQNLIADECDCVDFEQPIPKHLSHFRKAKNYCQKIVVPATLEEIKNFSFNHEQVAKNANKSQCAIKFKQKTVKEGSLCRSPCIYYTYESSVSSTRWPSPSFHSQFLNALRRMGNLTRFKLRKTYKNNTNDTEYLRRLKNIDIVESRLNEILDEHVKNNTLSDFFDKRFLAIQLSRPSFDIERVEEKAVISLTSFLSQVGGLLSIWVGLSFVCIVEIIELLLNISDTLFNR